MSRGKIDAATDYVCSGVANSLIKVIDGRTVISKPNLYKFLI
jgi:hypothetical protein